MISRRDTLIACGALAAVGVWPGLAAGDPGGAKAGALRLALRSPESARVVGRAYLATHPDEADPVQLLAAIEAAGGIGRSVARQPIDATALARAVAEAVRDDFLDRRTVRVDGWVLARTEARLCALAALT
jgi:hypothetical protein